MTSVLNGIFLVHRADAPWLDLRDTQSCRTDLDGIKEFRRVITRHGKIARNFLSAVHLAVCRFQLLSSRNRLFEARAWREQ